MLASLKESDFKPPYSIVISKKGPLINARIKTKKYRYDYVASCLWGRYWKLTVPAANSQSYPSLKRIEVYENVILSLLSNLKTENV